MEEGKKWRERRKKNKNERNAGERMQEKED